MTTTQQTAWATTAIDAELRKLTNLPEENINKPGSVFSVSLLKIASVVKGNGGISHDKTIQAIIAACNGHGIAEKEIYRQWNRALKTARPRTPTTPAPAPIVTPNGNQPTPRGTLTIDVKNHKTKDYVKALAWLEYEFAMRDLDDRVFCNGQEISDAQEDVIYNRMRDIGLPARTWVKSAWMQLAWENPFNPIKDYLNGLEWDGKDWISHLVSGFLNEKTGLGEAAFTRWMVGSVAKIMGQQQNFMLVLDGPQGIGKSTLARWLCPLPEYFLEDAIRPDDKDYLLRLCNRWIWEVAELQSTTRKADREALKAFITKGWVDIRKAYGRNDITKPALASLIGTINEDGAGFLTDPTGNRRYVVVYLQRIDWGYEQLDISQLWAQAVHLYRNGHQWRLSPEEATLRDQINQRYQRKSIFAEMFDAEFGIDYRDDSDRWTSSLDIIHHLENVGGLKGNQQMHLNELGQLMKQRGVPSVRVRYKDRRISAWRGVHLLQDDISEKWKERLTKHELNL